MAFDKYKDGAWMEPEDTVRRYDKTSGAWVECESAQRKIDGAWQEAWSAMDVMSVGACNLTNGDILITHEKRKFNFSKFEDRNQQVGSLSGDGQITFQLEGEWVNPTISFYWQGGMNYWSPNYSVCYGKVAGRISIAAYNSSGGTLFSKAITVGQSRTNGGNSMILYDGSPEYAVSGIVTKVAITVTPFAFTDSYCSGCVEIYISDLTIGDEPIGFTPDAEAYSKYISDY